MIPYCILVHTVDGSEIPFPTTVWMVLNPVVNNGLNYQPQQYDMPFPTSSTKTHTKKTHTQHEANGGLGGGGFGPGTSRAMAKCLASLGSLFSGRTQRGIFPEMNRGVLIPVIPIGWWAPNYKVCRGNIYIYILSGWWFQVFFSSPRSLGELD